MDQKIQVQNIEKLAGESPAFMNLKTTFKTKNYDCTTINPRN